MSAAHVCCILKYSSMSVRISKEILCMPVEERGCHAFQGKNYMLFEQCMRMHTGTPIRHTVCPVIIPRQARPCILEHKHDKLHVLFDMTFTGAVSLGNAQAHSSGLVQSTHNPRALFGSSIAEALLIRAHATHRHTGAAPHLMRCEIMCCLTSRVQVPCRRHGW